MIKQCTGALLGSALLLAAASSRADEAVHVTAQGQGNSRNQAVAAALATAVRRSLPEATREFPDLDGFFLDYLHQEQALPLDRLGSAHRLGSFYNPASAFIRSYSIDRSERTASGWTAVISADISQEIDSDVDLSKTLAIAVPPPVLQQEDEGEVAGGDALLELLAAKTDLGLLRARLHERLAKQNHVKPVALTTAQDQALENASESPAQFNWRALGEAAGDPVVLTLAADEFSLSQKLYPRGQSSLNKPLWDLVATLNYRVINSPNGELLASGRLRLDLNNERIYRAALAQKGDSAALAKQRVLNEIAQQLIAEVLATVQPPRVLRRSGSDIVVHPGQLSLKPGQRLAALSAGELVTDEVTGLPHRLDGARIALVEIQQRNGELYEARVIQGSADTLLRGTVLRATGQLPLKR